jgi:hypothetical protein
MQKRKLRLAEEQSGLDKKGVSMTFETRVEDGSLENSNKDSIKKFGLPLQK